MIQTIFGSPVVILNTKNSKELFSEEVYNEMFEHLMDSKNKFVEHPYTRGGKICTTDLNSTINQDKINRIDSLLNFLKQTGLMYAHLFTDEPIKDLEFHTMWINLSFEGCEIKNHYDRYDDTDKKSLIILFYPKSPANGSNLVFIHNSKYGEWSSDREDKDLVKINIEEGNIIIFDNHVLHAIDKHKSVDPRMCLATEFNFV